MNQNNGQVYQVLSPSQLDKQLQLSSDTEIESSPPPQKGLNLRPYLRTIKRKAILIAGITAMTTAAANFFGPKPPPPVYEGRFQLLVEPVTSAAKLSEPSRLARNEQKTNDKFFELDYSTILEILNGAKMRTNIINKIKEKYPTFKSSELQDSFTVERLVKEGTARGQSGETSIIQVTYQNSDPELAKIVLDAAAQGYLKYSLEERKTRIGEGVKFIEEQVPELQKRVDDSRKKLQAMQERYNLIDPQKTGEELFGKLRQINDEKIATQRQLQELNALSNNLQAQLKLTLDEAINASTVSEDPSYQKLREDLKEIESQIATESARFEPEAPQIKALQEKKQNLQNLIDGELQRILGDNSASTTSNSQVLNFQNSTRQELIKQLADTKNQIQVLEVRNQELIQTQKYFERQAQQFPAIANQYNITQQQLELANQTLKQLLSQRETLRVEAAQDTVPWELISPPEIPHDADGNPIPMSSPSDKNLMIGLAAGLLLGLGTALLYEKFRDIFYTVEELEEVTQLPLLSKIPLARRSKSSTNLTPFIGAFEDVAPSHKSVYLFLEAFDSLYTNIRFCFSTRPVRALAVCSATPGDGKSTIALQLAQTAAAMGQQVLLVDANLRSPRLHRWLNLPNLQGLSDILDNQSAPDEFIQRSPLAENLFVLTSGQPLPNSPKRLASAQMRYLKEKFQAKFDLVIYDTPNLLNYTDASFLAANTDGILMVVRVGETKQSLVNQALDKLKNFGLPILGVVANRVHPSALATSPQAEEFNGDEISPEYLGSGRG